MEIRSTNPGIQSVTYNGEALEESTRFVFGSRMQVFAVPDALVEDGSGTLQFYSDVDFSGEHIDGMCRHCCLSPYLF